MALDFIIENNKTYDKEYLPIGVETHWEIYTLAKDHNLPLISTVADYSADYTFKVEDLNNLLIEIEELLRLAKKDSQLEFLQELKKLVMSAKEQQQNIILRAD